MFCENCGKQLPDDSAFCDNCGMQMAPVAPVAPAQPVPEKQPFVLTKQHKIIGLAVIGVVILAIIIAIIVGIAGKTIKLKKYVTVTTEGYNGYASIDYEVDYAAIFEKMTGEDVTKFEDMEDFESLKNSAQLLQKAALLETGLDVEVTYPDGKSGDRLANGDVVTIVLTFDEKVADQLDIKVKNATIEHKVEGLADANVYDVLSHFDVTFEGYEGNGTATIVPKDSTETVGGIRFTTDAERTRVDYYVSSGDYEGYFYMDISNSEDLANGDKVTLIINAEADELSEYGVILDGLTKEYTVSGLKDAASFDLLANHTVVFSGVEGEGKAVLSVKDSEITVGEIVFTTKADRPNYVYWEQVGNSYNDGSFYIDFDKSAYDLKTGDVLTLRCTNDADYLASYGVMLTNMSKEYTVNSLGKYATVLADISADSITALTAKYTEDLKNRMYEDWGDVVHNSWSSFSEQSIGEDMALYKAIFTTSKNTASSEHNSLWLVFSVTLDDNSITTPTVYYFYYQIRNVVVGADGTVDMQADYSINKSYGYTDYNKLYSDRIDSFSLNIEVLE